MNFISFFLLFSILSFPKNAQCKNQLVTICNLRSALEETKRNGGASVSLPALLGRGVAGGGPPSPGNHYQPQHHHYHSNNNTTSSATNTNNNNNTASSSSSTNSGPSSYWSAFWRAWSLPSSTSTHSLLLSVANLNQLQCLMNSRLLNLRIACSKVFFFVSN